VKSLRQAVKVFRRRVERWIKGPECAPVNLPSPEDYWSEHTVHVSDRLASSPEASLRYFHWRCDRYPGYLDLMPVRDLDDLDVLDYGCGPGHDLVGIATYSNPRSLTGLDISDRALAVANQRLALHDFGRHVNVRTLSGNTIPLPDSSIDYVHSSGVLHHLENPLHTLREFARVMRPTARIRIMVYNRDSLWWHLYVPYVLQIRKRLLDPDIPLATAFRMSTDGLQCPVSVAYSTESFSALAAEAGLETTFIGTSISRTELDAWRKWGRRALADDKLSDEHRLFLREIGIDASGMPRRLGAVPGINLVLELTRTSVAY